MTRTIRVSMIAIATFCSACAATSVPVQRSVASTNSSNLTLTNAGSSNGTSSSGSSSSGSSSGSTGTGTESPISLRVGAVGYTSTTVTISTGKILKIKFTPGVQDQAISGTGVYPQYSHLGVYVTVNGTTEATEMLDNGFRSGQAQTSSVMDFSSSLPSCGSDGCRQTVTITIDHPNNDYFCLNYGQYCPWAYVYQTHPWHGTLTVQTDDTVGI